MGRVLPVRMGRTPARRLLVLCLVAAPVVWAQSGGSGGAREGRDESGSRTVLGTGSTLLSAGAQAIRAGRYEEGIRLTTLGLERDAPRGADRAAAYSNLCAAHAAHGEPDTAVEYCTRSLTLNGDNWRAYSNRAYAYYLQGMYSEAVVDIDAAARINPRAREVEQIRGMINEQRLQPRIVLEEHQ